MYLGDRLVILSVLFFVMFILTGAVPPYFNSYEEGEEAYEEGRYEESAEHFDDALTGGGDPDVLRYNIGNARYKSGDYSEAEASFRSALVEGDGDAAEFYNIGNALVMQAGPKAETGDFEGAKELLRSAIESYEKALDIDYTDADAIHNSEYAKRMIEELDRMQQEQEQQGKGDSSDEQDESDEGESESDSQGEQEQESDDSDGQDEQQSEDEGEGEDQQDPQGGENEQQDEGQPENEQRDDRPNPENDGLDISEEEIDALLDYYEQKERMNENFKLWDMMPQSIFGDFPESPLRREDDWIDW
jgi:Ca-activated chloride channel family protein